MHIHIQYTHTLTYLYHNKIHIQIIYVQMDCWNEHVRTHLRCKSGQKGRRSRHRNLRKTGEILCIAYYRNSYHMHVVAKHILESNCQIFWIRSEIRMITFCLLFLSMWTRQCVCVWVCVIPQKHFSIVIIHAQSFQESAHLRKQNRKMCQLYTYKCTTSFTKQTNK